MSKWKPLKGKYYILNWLEIINIPPSLLRRYQRNTVVLPWKYQGFTTVYCGNTKTEGIPRNPLGLLREQNHTIPKHCHIILRYPVVFFGIPWYFSVYRGISRDHAVSRGITLVSLRYRAGIDGFVDFDFSYFTFVFNFVQKGPLCQTWKVNLASSSVCSRTWTLALRHIVYNSIISTKY